MTDEAEKPDAVEPVIKPTMGEILLAVERDVDLFPCWPSDPLHALAMLGDKVGELNKAMLLKTYEQEAPGASDEAAYQAAIQTAALAIRLVISLPDYEPESCVQHIQDGV